MVLFILSRRVVACNDISRMGNSLFLSVNAHCGWPTARQRPMPINEANKSVVCKLWSSWTSSLELSADERQTAGCCHIVVTRFGQSLKTFLFESVGPNRSVNHPSN